MAKLLWTWPSCEGNQRYAQAEVSDPSDWKEGRCNGPEHSQESGPWVLLVSRGLAGTPGLHHGQSLCSCFTLPWATAASLPPVGLDGKGWLGHRSVSTKQEQTHPDPTETRRLRGPERLSDLTGVTRQVGGRAREEPGLFQSPFHWGLLPPGKLSSVPCHACGFKFPSIWQLFHLQLPGLGVITWPCVWLT